MRPTDLQPPYSPANSAVSPMALPSSQSFFRMIIYLSSFSVALFICYSNMATQAGLNTRTTQEPGTLTRLTYSEQSPHHMNLNIIFVPEMRITTSGQDTQPRWPQSLIRPIDSKAQLLWFDYLVDINPNTSIWQSLIEQGDNLIAAIEQNTKTFQLTQRPLIFVCHGFGGLVLKRALIGLHKNFYRPNVRPLLEAESGIVFLGTPHPTYEHRQYWDKLALPLLSLPNLPKQSIVQAEIETAIVAGISSALKESGIDVPVLSVYETKKSRIGSWWSGRKKKLVDDKIAQTFLSMETLVGVDLEHNDLVSLPPGSHAHSALKYLIETAVNKPFVPTIPQATLNREPPAQNQEFEWASDISQFDSSGRQQGSRPSGIAISSEDAASFVVISQVSELVAPRKEPKLPYYAIPSHKLDPLFFGRRGVLSNLDEALLPPRPQEHRQSGIYCFALCGLGGIGKTQIAAEYVMNRKDHFDAVFWVEADDESKLAETFGSIAVHLGLEDGSETLDNAVSRNIVLEWLTNPVKLSERLNGERIPASEKATWLLVFDNADHPEFLRDYWPTATTNGAILVTTRKPLGKMSFELTVAGCKSVKNIGMDLDPFTPTEAVEFLRKATEFEETSLNLRNAEALANRLNGLPLAMRQIVPLIKMFSVEKVWNIIEEKMVDIVEHLGHVSLSTQGGTYHHTLLTVWAFEALKENAMRLLEVISFMDPDNITESLLFLADGSTTNAAIGYPQTKREHDEARDELAESSLIRYTSIAGIISIHRLVQDVVQVRMPPERAEKTFELLVDLLNHSWPWVPDQFAHDTTFHLWKRCNAILPHVRMLANLYRLNPRWKLSEKALREYVKLLQASSWYLIESGNHEVAENLIYLTLAISREHLDYMRDVLADTLFCLCVMGYKTNMPPEKLYKYAEEHLKHREVLNDGSEIAKTMLGAAHSTLGMAHMLLGHFESAVDHCDASRLIEKSTLEVISGKAHPHFANIFGAYALSALGRDEEALEHLEDTIRFRRELYGDEKSAYKLGCALQAKGDILMKQGKFGESYDIHFKAWEIYKLAVGPTYWGAAQVCIKLGEYSTHQRKPIVAKTFFDQALKAFESHSCYAPEIARLKFKYAKFHEAFEDFDQARDYMEQAKNDYNNLVYGAPNELSAKDFDELVVIFSR